MRYFAVGDIHGCYDKLAKLLEIIPYQDDDVIVFLGDYIDRGSESRKVVEYLIDFRQSREVDKTIFLSGNHEKMLLDYLSGRNRELFLLNGGEATINQYLKNGIIEIPDKHLNFFETLKNIYISENYIFVHAGLMPGVAIENQREEDLLWIRGDFIFSEFDFKKKVIFGHTPMKSHQPFFDKYKIGIDTGAVYGGFLTAIELPLEKIYQS